MIYLKLKRQIKLIIFIIAIVFMCMFLHIWLMRDIVAFINNIAIVTKDKELIVSPSINTKYILLWDTYYLIISKRGRNIFTTLNCPISSCLFTENKLLIGDYTKFDAIIFNEGHLNTAERPSRRERSQIYIFTTIESASNKPACELYNDDFYNWTFTYRLDSDVVWNYFVVRNVRGDIVAPSAAVQWQANKHAIPHNIRAILQGRTRAAAWIVSNCRADSLRDEYLTRLQEHLFHYSLQIDVYGRCSKRKCDNDDCEEMLRKNHYFYMAFENSLADDYVTEKVLHGYDNYVVPIVYGGANYSRFLPPGSYINAREYHPYNLAGIIYQAIKHPEIYEAYFHWTNFYTIDSDPKIYHPLCELCKSLNSEKAEYAPVKKNFRFWWNTLNGMKWCLPMEFWNETSKINIDGNHVYGNHLY